VWAELLPGARPTLLHDRPHNLCQSRGRSEIVSQFLLSVISGIASGAVYGLIGLGLVIIYQATDVVHFGMASMATAALYVASTMQARGFGGYGALLVAVGVAVLAGLIVREVLIRPLGSGQVFAALVVTMGLALILDDVTQRIWSGVPRSYPALVKGQMTIGGAPVQYQQLLTIGVAAAAMLAVSYLFRRTALGSAMRAVAESAGTAQLLGVRSQQIGRIAWGLGMALAVLGAGLFAPTVGLTVGGLQGILFRALAGIFLGGLTSMYGAVVGGLLIGVLDNLAASYVSASFRDTFVFAIAILVLLVRPQGIFGRRTFQRV
jgi:branched-chain amino acid transport system permease protein